MQFNVHDAKTNLSKLIEAALAGEEVIIARDSKPAVRLVPVARNGFKMGMLSGKLDPKDIPDFLEPMPEEELQLWEGGEIEPPAS